MCYVIIGKRIRNLDVVCENEGFLSVIDSENCCMLFCGVKRVLMKFWS